MKMFVLKKWMLKFGKVQNKNYLEQKLKEILILMVMYFHYVRK